jgi:hypothetical protein
VGCLEWEVLAVAVTAAGGEAAEITAVHPERKVAKQPAIVLEVEEWNNSCLGQRSVTEGKGRTALRREKASNLRE